MKTMLTFLLLATSAFAGEFAGLTPGQSTLADAKKALGTATIRGNAMRFDGDRFEASDILVEADDAMGVIQSITVVPRKSPTLEQVTEWFQLKSPDAREKSGEEEVLTYHPQLLSLSVRGANVTRLTHVAPAMITTASRKTIDALLAKGDRAGAIAGLIKLREVNPADLDLAFTLSETLLEEGDAESALEVVSEGLRLSPDNEYGALLKRFVEGELMFRSPGWLGIHLGDRRVTRVFKGTPATDAGLLEGDIIRSIMGTEPFARGHLRGILCKLKVGDPVKVKYQRGNTMREVEMTPIDRDAYFREYQPSDDLEAAMILEEQGKTLDADKLVRQVVKATPTPGGNYELAQIAEALKMEDGIKEWKRFMEKTDKETPEAWMRDAQEAIAALEKAIPVYRKGRELEKADKFQEALEELSVVYADSSNHLFYQGYCLKRLKRYPEAVHLFSTGLSYWQTEPIGWSNVAECCEYFNLAMARAAAVRFLKLTAGDEKKKNLIDKNQERKARVEAALARRLLAARLESKGLLSQALSDYEAASAGCPNSTELMFDRARVLVALNRHKEASLINEEAEALLPGCMIGK
ncbi:MAG: hypothetical protein A2Z34_09545 [Planctomycetes bacterium RBG_16_59_8]|nr:MAG: hypothetical protein A2Z34_09545 [Planctomycetes bacterium RBG_16_59_8]